MGDHAESSNKTRSGRGDLPNKSRVKKKKKKSAKRKPKTKQ